MNKQLLERVDNLLVNLINEGRDVKSLRNQVYEELKKEYVSPLADNEVGARLTGEYLQSKGFTRHVCLEGHVDEYSIWSLNGFDVYEEVNWNSEDSIKYPYNYCFATLLRGSGEVKSSYQINTETQLNNIYYSFRGIQL